MKALKRYKYHLVAALVLIGLLMMGVRTRTGAVTKSVEELPKVGSTFQMHHSLELLADEKQRYGMVAQGTSEDMRKFILRTVQKSLPKKYKHQAYTITRAVITEANHFQMDPLFLLAVISTESKFNVDARGRHGEIGLMQVLPKTALWLAARAGYTEYFNLEDPATNIRIGATYLAQLRHKFNNNTRRYIGAYNMGVSNVNRLVAKKVEPAIYPGRVISNYTKIYLEAGGGIEAQASRGIASSR